MPALALAAVGSAIQIGTALKAGQQAQQMKVYSDKYKQASTQFQDAYNKYMGQTGLSKATDYAQKTALQNAKESALASSTGASSQAMSSARRAGLTSAQAAALGSGAGVSQYANQFGSAYNNLYSQGLANALNQYQSTANLAQTNLKTAQQEGQAEYERAKGKVDTTAALGSAMGSTVSGLGTAIGSK